jgi:DNA-binding transcriptional ArsR family regulator
MTNDIVTTTFSREALAASIADDIAQLERNARRASALLKAIGNERRLMILCQLVRLGEASVGELANLVGLGQSALSQHLARLRREHVVATRRDGQTIYYSLVDGEAVTVMNALHAAFCGPDKGPKRRRGPRISDA